MDFGHSKEWKLCPKVRDPLPRGVEITIEHESIKMSIAETSEERWLYSQANCVFEGKCEIKALGTCVEKTKRHFDV